MRIGEAAERLGVSARTIKYYEELGLLQPNRSQGNYRDYDDDDIERFERIRNLQRLGFSLAAIREFIKYPRQLDESGRRRLRTSDFAAAVHELEQQLEAARERVFLLRSQLALDEKLSVELEADVARARERLALRDAAPLAAANSATTEPQGEGR